MAWVKKGFIDPKSYRYAEVVLTSWEDRAADQKPVPLTPMNQDMADERHVQSCVG